MIILHQKNLYIAVFSNIFLLFLFSPNQLYSHITVSSLYFIRNTSLKLSVFYYFISWSNFQIYWKYRGDLQYVCTTLQSVVSVSNGPVGLATELHCDLLMVITTTDNSVIGWLAAMP